MGVCTCGHCKACTARLLDAVKREAKPPRRRVRVGALGKAR